MAENKMAYQEIWGFYTKTTCNIFLSFADRGDKTKPATDVPTGHTPHTLAHTDPEVFNINSWKQINMFERRIDVE